MLVQLVMEIVLPQLLPNGRASNRQHAAKIRLDQNANRVQLSTDVTNAAMRGAAERAGFRFEGVMRSYISPGEGEPAHDYALYGRTREDHRNGS